MNEKFNKQPLKVVKKESKRLSLKAPNHELAVKMRQRHSPSWPWPKQPYILAFVFGRLFKFKGSYHPRQFPAEKPTKRPFYEAPAGLEPLLESAHSFCLQASSLNKHSSMHSRPRSSSFTMCHYEKKKRRKKKLGSFDAKLASKVKSNGKTFLFFMFGVVFEEFLRTLLM